MTIDGSDSAGTCYLFHLFFCNSLKYSFFKNNMLEFSASARLCRCQHLDANMCGDVNAAGRHADLHSRRMLGSCSPPYLRCAMRHCGRSNWLRVCWSEGHERDDTVAIELIGATLSADNGGHGTLRAVGR